MFSVEIEQFTDCFYVKFERVHCARYAKAKVDRRNFYGGSSYYTKCFIDLNIFFFECLG